MQGGEYEAAEQRKVCLSRWGGWPDVFAHRAEIEFPG